MDMDEVAKKILQGRAEQNADNMAPAYKNIMNPAENAVNRNKKSMTQSIMEAGPFDKLERDLPRGGSGAMKTAVEEAGERGLKQEGKAAAEAGASRLGRFLIPGLAGGAVGLGADALLEGLNAEPAGSEGERMDEAAMAQGMKTEAKLKAEKAANKPVLSNETYPAMEETEMKKTPKTILRKSTTTTFAPKPRSDQSIVKGFNAQLDKHFGPAEDDDMAAKPARGAKGTKVEGLDKIEGIMRGEFKKAADESNKKPISKYMKR